MLTVLWRLTLAVLCVLGAVALLGWLLRKHGP